ncbi:hypothetical protein FRC10_011332 [Ceratobasidium sp. 414]|nr:hypothetical protein FRC10_011332 [Ceratobasidium sp. 414]
MPTLAVALATNSTSVVVNINAVNATLQAAVITLSTCLKGSHRDLGERLFEDMPLHALKPAAQTYARLIPLSLTEVEYERASETLEEINEMKVTPQLAVYEALVRRLVEEGIQGDIWRWKISSIVGIR